MDVQQSCLYYIWLGLLLDSLRAFVDHSESSSNGARPFQSFFFHRIKTRDMILDNLMREIEIERQGRNGGALGARAPS